METLGEDGRTSVEKPVVALQMWKLEIYSNNRFTITDSGAMIHFYFPKNDTSMRLVAKPKYHTCFIICNFW